MRLLVEIGRFILTAFVVAFAVVLLLTVISQFINGAMSFEGFSGILGIAFFFTLVGGAMFGLPMLWFAKSLGWDRHPWKLTAIGVASGLICGLALTLPAYGSTGAFKYPAEILPFWSGLGAFSGLIAAQTWYWLHRSESMEIHD